MPQVVFTEFRNATENNKYPFIDTATLTDIDNTVTLPQDIFIDANIYLPGTIGMVYISSIIVGADETVITIQDSENTVRGTCTIRTIDNVTTSDYVLPIYNNTYKVGALVLSGTKLSYFKSLPQATYNFYEEATAFVPSCLTILPKLGITSIAVNDRTKANTVYGNIWLVGWRGVHLRTQNSVENSIRIDVVGDPLFKQAAYPDAPYEVPMPIMTINGLPPDEYGNFNITTTTAKDCLRVATTEQGLYIYMAGANGN